MSVSPCPDASAAGWLQAGEQPWEQLVTTGPLGFAAYARLRFIPDPTRAGQSESQSDADKDAPSESEQLCAAVEVLAAHTTTAHRCFFALWDGWGFTPTVGQGAARVRLPGRDYFLFTASAADLGQREQWRQVLCPPAGHPSWVEPPDPALVWPADRAWCLVNDVDPHYAGIAASSAAVEALLAQPSLDAVRTTLAQEPPQYR